MGKVLVVGLDGATFKILKPLAADGRLPNLARMLRSGASGILSSTIPPVTPAAWTSFFTGKNPGKHGIYDFQEIDPANYKFRHIRTDEHREKTIWQLLGEADLRSIIVDVPFTYPPKPLHGLMITGYGTPRTPETVFTYPADLATSLPEDVRAEVKVALPTHKFDRSQAFIDEWEAVMKGRRRLVPYLIREQAWDLFMVVFSITDNMAHVFWTYVDPAHPNYYRPEGQAYREAFRRSYEMCDALLGQMMEIAGPEATTIVISDHGFGSVRPRQYIMQLLYDGRYAYPLQAAGSSLFGDRLIRLVLNSYNNFPRLREWAKRLRPGQRRTFKKSLARANLMPNTVNIDPARSRLLPSNFGLRIWVNEAGVFAHGIVAPEEKEALLQDVTKYLKSQRDIVSGRQIIREVYRARDLYHGPFAERSPDLVIEYADFHMPEETDPARNPYLEGGHTPDGILLVSGPAIKPGKIEGATLIDLAPTILHLFGDVIPPDMDGRVLTELFDDEYLASHPVRQGEIPAQNSAALSGDGLNARQQAELEKQLRQLGYLG